MSDTTLVVIAKDPVPGRVKTRLSPTLSFEQAADLAAAAIADTFDAMAQVPTASRVLYFDGSGRLPGTDGYRVVPQSTGTLDERIADVFDAYAGRPVLLIGMDTPQLTARMLAPAFDERADDVDAWFGPATDGGWWALGLREARGDLIRGIPTSRDDTGARQLGRLLNAGLRVDLLPELTDVDTIDDALEVAALIPDSRFARTLDSARTATPSGAWR